MKKSGWKILFLVCIVLTFTFNSAIAGHGKKKEMKKGILLVAFGTSVPEAQVAFDNIEKKVEKEFKNVPVRWAYTSTIIRKKLAKQGKNLDSVEMALAKMMDDGFTHVAVQSLHTIRGIEYDNLVKTVKAYSHMPEGFQLIMTGTPLLSSQKDMMNVVDAIIENIPSKRKNDEAVVLMGHGSHHPANAYYAALMFHLQRKDPNIFVGTVEGAPEIDDIKEMLEDNKIKKAWLIPFMAVAGDHAMNDMAGSEDDSWKSILTKEGISCETVMKGTAEYDNMVSVWTGHLKDVMAHY